MNPSLRARLSAVVTEEPAQRVVAGLLDEVRDREILVGAVVCCRFARVDGPEAFTALVQPGFGKAGMNFLLHDEGGGWTRVSTETRVHGTDTNVVKARRCAMATKTATTTSANEWAASCARVSWRVSCPPVMPCAIGVYST